VCSSRAVAAAGRDRQPAVSFGPLATFGSAEQPSAHSIRTIIARAILLCRLVALAAQLLQACMDRREIIGSAGSCHVSSWYFGRSPAGSTGLSEKPAHAGAAAGL
jgi:hypothetical protein